MGLRPISYHDLDTPGIHEGLLCTFRSFSFFEFEMDFPNFEMENPKHSMGGEGVVIFQDILDSANRIATS